MLNKIFKIAFILATFFMLPSFASAATGDLLWQCNFEGAGVTPLAVVSACGGGAGGVAHAGSSIVASGGQDGGKYINFYYANAGEVYAPFGLSSLTIHKTELTYEYYEKFDKAYNDGIDLWNVKSSRVLAEGSGYFGFVAREYAGYWEQTTVPNGRTLLYELIANAVPTPDSPCTNISGSNWSCPDGRIAFRSTPNINDTAWHKVRYYTKLPSGESATDGVVKFWLDNVLIYTINNIPGWVGMGAHIGEVRFNPSMDLLSGAKSTFNHAYDDITIYEGLVEPTLVIPDITPPAMPTGLSV